MARSALLSLLLLKLPGKERLRHIDDFGFEPVPGLFAGLDMLPKKSFATEHSCRCVRPNQQKLLSAWTKALSGLLFPEGRTFSLDFRPIPYRGDPAALEKRRIPLAGKAAPRVPSFFALEQSSRLPCCPNAGLVRSEQAGEAMRFVESWHALAGSDPERPYFASRTTTYPELSPLAASASPPSASAARQWSGGCGRCRRWPGPRR